MEEKVKKNKIITNMEDKVKKIITNLYRRNGQREWLLQTFVEMLKQNKILTNIYRRNG